MLTNTARVLLGSATIALVTATGVGIAGATPADRAAPAPGVSAGPGTPMTPERMQGLMRPGNPAMASMNDLMDSPGMRRMHASMMVQ